MEKIRINNKSNTIVLNSSPASAKQVLKTSFKKLPARLQPLLWSKSIKKIDIEKDRVYIIHQVLAYGSLEDIGMLFKIYPGDEVKNIFLNYPKNTYTRPVFLFIKNFLLKINEELVEEKYVKNLFKSS